MALPASLSLARGEALRAGSGGKPAASAAEGWAARGRELETDLIKGGRPGGDHGDRDTHLNNSGTNKSFRLGCVQDVK